MPNGTNFFWPVFYIFYDPFELKWACKTSLTPTGQEMAISQLCAVQSQLHTGRFDSKFSHIFKTNTKFGLLY